MAFDKTTPAGASPADAGEAAPVRYALEFGHSYVPADEVQGFKILNPRQQATLAAWADALIPTGNGWPSASATGAHIYADNTSATRPRLRALLVRAIDSVDIAAGERGADSFAGCEADVRAEILAELEGRDAMELFDFVLELVFEGYYRDPAVLELVEDRTGFRIMAPIEGAELEPFDEGLVAEMKKRPAFVREVPA
jgi:Gluconate 2-dehydrogenase subunit 3